MNKLLASLLTVLFVSPTFVGDLRSADLYVNNRTGDDRFDGSLPTPDDSGSGPFRTIGRALQNSSSGYRIHIANTGEPYRESLTLQGPRHSGSARRPFELIGNGAILEGAVPVPSEAWQHDQDEVYRYRPPKTSHQMLFLDGVPAERVPVGPDPSQRPELEPLQWCLFQRHIYFRPEPGTLPDEHAASYSSLPVGITLYRVGNVVVRELIIQGFQLDGINAHDGVVDTTVRDVIARGNARSGISVGGASRLKIEESTLGDNGTAQLRTEGHSQTRVSGSSLLDHTAPAVVHEGGHVEIQETPRNPPQP